MASGLKEIRWIGSSQKVLRTFLPKVRLDVGFALYAAQKGETDPAAKPLKGFGATQSRKSWRRSMATLGARSTRCVFRGFVYVLHAFQKKSKTGIATPKAEIDLIHQRLAIAERYYGESKRA